MRLRTTALVVGTCLIGAVGCVNSAPEIELSEPAAIGRTIANESGCAACHGDWGQGTTAPSWQGIYLEQIPLDGGTTVLADDEYLFRSIREPQAEIVESWTIKMPENNLNDDQINSIVAYIKELK